MKFLHTLTSWVSIFLMIQLSIHPAALHAGNRSLDEFVGMTTPQQRAAIVLNDPGCEKYFCQREDVRKLVEMLRKSPSESEKKKQSKAESDPTGQAKKAATVTASAVNHKNLPDVRKRKHCATKTTDVGAAADGLRDEELGLESAGAPHEEEEPHSEGLLSVIFEWAGVAEQGCLRLSSIHESFADKTLHYLINVIFLGNGALTFATPIIAHAAPYPEYVRPGLLLVSSGLQVVGGALKNHSDNRQRAKAKSEQKELAASAKTYKIIVDSATNGLYTEYASEEGGVNETTPLHFRKNSTKEESTGISSWGGNLAFFIVGFISFFSALYSLSGHDDYEDLVSVVSTSAQGLGVYFKRIENNRMAKDSRERREEIRQNRSIFNNEPTGADAV